MPIKGRLCVEFPGANAWNGICPHVWCFWVRLIFVCNWVEYIVFLVETDISEERSSSPVSFMKDFVEKWEPDIFYRSCFGWPVGLGVGLATDDVVKWKIASWVNSRSISASVLKIQIFKNHNFKVILICKKTFTKPYFWKNSEESFMEKLKINLFGSRLISWIDSKRLIKTVLE